MAMVSEIMKVSLLSLVQSIPSWGVCPVGIGSSVRVVYGQEDRLNMVGELRVKGGLVTGGGEVSECKEDGGRDGYERREEVERGLGWDWTGVVACRRLERILVSS